MVRDPGSRVERSVANVQTALIEGALLTVLVVFLFLNSWRSTVITGLALPVSVLASFIAVWAFGFTLNTMSLLGLSLAIGILIDDAIVVRENIVRHVEMGKDHYTASREGTAEIGLAVAATTFSIVAVFVPDCLHGGGGGAVVQALRPDDCLRRAGLAVRLLLARPDAVRLLARSARREEHEKLAYHPALDRFNHWFDRRTEDYERLIGWALDHRWTMVAIAVASFVGALCLQATHRRRRLRAGGRPLRVRSHRRDAAGRQPRLHASRGRGGGAIARAHPEVAYTYITVGSPLPTARPGWTRHRCTSS